MATTTKFEIEGREAVVVDPSEPAAAWAVLSPQIPARCPWCHVPIAVERTRNGTVELCGECDDEEEVDYGAVSCAGSGDWGRLPRLPDRHLHSAPPQPPPPPPPGYSRWVCISDTHGRHGEMGAVPDGDVLVHSGDLTNQGEPSQIESLVKWLQALPHRHKVVIAGNHDLTLHEEFYSAKQKCNEDAHVYQQDDARARQCLRSADGIDYLEDASVSVLGYNVYGSPWQPEFCDWAYNLQRGQQCADKWREIPTETDVLVTHGPPLGHGDLVRLSLGAARDGRAGCVDLLKEVTQRVKPLYHIFGHVHSGWGATTDGSTRFINASTCTSRYKPINPPIVFDLPPRVVGIPQSAAAPQVHVE